MSRVRFATANDLFETFPELLKTIKVLPNDKPPLDFLKDLSVDEKLEDAVTFCAFLLPRREAVWWACRSVRSRVGNGPRQASRGAPRRRSLGAAARNRSPAGRTRHRHERRSERSYDLPGVCRRVVRRAPLRTSRASGFHAGQHDTARRADGDPARRPLRRCGGAPGPPTRMHRRRRQAGDRRIVIRGRVFP